ncbi:MAG: FG-GAP-like repeat-containing protein [Isosphaeraceae bacterium]
MPIILFAVAGCTGSSTGVTAPAGEPAPAMAPLGSSPDDGIPPEHREVVLREFYRGIGRVERHEYQEAVAAFEKVRDLAPRWTPGSINLAIAAMYTRDSTWAMQILDGVLACDPDNLYARYCRGLIHKESGSYPRAYADFRFVVEKDPNDAEAWYMLGSSVEIDPNRIAGREDGRRVLAERLGEHSGDLRKALECDPYLYPAIYRLAVVARRRGDQEEARRLFGRFGWLHEGPGGVPAGDDFATEYGRQGRYAWAIEPQIDRASLDTPFRPPHFARPAALKVALADGERWASALDFTGRLAVIGRARTRFGAPVAALDADGDGRLDVFLPAAVTGPKGVRDALLLNRGDGTFEDASQRLGLPVDRASLGAAAADFDIDGRVDLAVTGLGEVRVLRNEGPRGFRDVSALAGVVSPAALCLTARWLDLDQDGDLDLFVVNHTTLENSERAFTGTAPPGAACSVYRNDGRPIPVAGSSGEYAVPRPVAMFPERASPGLSIKLALWTGADAPLGAAAAHTGLAVLDLEDDGDLDLVLSAEGEAPRALLNERLGQFRPAMILGVDPGAADAGLLVTDVDQDSRSDLVAVDRSGKVSVWRNQSRRRGPGSDTSITFERRPSRVEGWRAAIAADVDLDGWPDLVGLPVEPGQPLPGWVRGDCPRLSAMSLPVRSLAAEAPAIRALALVDLAGDPLPDLVLIRDGETPLLARNLGNGHHWLSIRLAGRWLASYRMRSNSHGIGVRIELLGPCLRVWHDGTTPGSGLAQSCAPVVLGLGTKESAAVLRVLWPDGARQSEVDVAADRQLDLVETGHRRGM